MRNLSGTFRLLFFGIVGAMVVLVGIALLTRPAPSGPLTAAQVEQTVVAEVDTRWTQTAAITPPTRLPDIEATVQARLAETPAPTGDPNLIPVSQLEGGGGFVSFVGGLINGAFALLRGLWNLFSFGGVGLQLCCCILIPLGALVALARESLHAP